MSLHWIFYLKNLDVLQLNVSQYIWKHIFENIRICRNLQNKDLNIFGSHRHWTDQYLNIFQGKNGKNTKILLFNLVWLLKYTGTFAHLGRKGIIVIHFNIVSFEWSLCPDYNSVLVYIPWWSVWLDDQCVLMMSVFWWWVCSDDQCVLMISVFWWSVCSDDQCVLMISVSWWSVCPDDQCVLMISVSCQCVLMSRSGGTHLAKRSVSLWEPSLRDRQGDSLSM